MNAADRQSPLLLVLLVGGAVLMLVISSASRWARSLLELAGHPAVVSLAGALLIFAVGLLAARLVVTRRALGRRVRMLVIPPDSFDPSDEAVVRFAAGLSRSRRALRGILDARASAVRVVLDADPDGRLRYAVEVPEHATASLRAALASYASIQLRPAPPPPAVDEDAQVEVARAELVLARASSEPLRAVGLDPDPLTGFARAIDGLDPDRGDTAAICVDLLPVTPGKRRRLRRRLLRRARHDHQPTQVPAEALAEAVGINDRSRGGAPPAEVVERWVGRQALARKLGSPEPMFELQVLASVSSPVPGRAKAQLAAVLATFDVFAGDNHLRVTGLRVPGVAFLGSDLPGRRRRFDRRLARGLFAPARWRVVTASEIAGLLKPPSAKCPAVNVVRSGGLVSPPPATLPTFTGQPDLLPLGKVEDEHGERPVGVPLRDTFFFYMAGRSRFGKTETGIGQFLHLARAGHGCLFLDPHVDAIRRIKGYLTDAGLRERVVELDLSDSERQTGWNPLAVAGRSRERAQGQVDGLVDAFASALRWDETNTRALNLVTQAAHALIDLARQLPPELAPTIFEIPTLLGNDDWRAAVLPHVSPPPRRFFVERFPRLAPEAITPVTNLIDRLRVSHAPAALLGNPTSTYDIRAAMDEGLIVLVCPGSGSGLDRLVANFIVYDLLHTAKTRSDTPPERRREFYAFLDEIQIYDGASSGTLAALLEQSAKFGIRLVLLNQNPERLTAATRDAITTNRSHLVTTALNAKAAALLGREFGRGVDPDVITAQPRFHSIAQVTHDGEISQPFRLRGVPVDELLPDACHPDQLDALDTAIDRNHRRVPVAQTLASLDGHHAEIVKHLRHGRQAARGKQTLPTARTS